MDFSWFLNECTVDVVGGGLPPKEGCVPPPPSLLEEGEGHRPNPKGRSEGIYK